MFKVGDYVRADLETPYITGAVKEEILEIHDLYNNIYRISGTNGNYLQLATLEGDILRFTDGGAVNFINAELTFITPIELAKLRIATEKGV